MTYAYQINELCFSYADDDPVIYIPHFEFNKNSITALLGANGAGKSTLLNLLAFLLSPQSGNLNFMGESATNRTLDTMRKNVAYVQQNPYLFNMTVYQNIELGLKIRGINKEKFTDKIERVLEQLEISDLRNENAHRVSGGEVQKVAIARALVLDPKVIILDEPFTYLDRKTTATLKRLISEIRKDRNKTLIFSTHDQLLSQEISDQQCLLIGGNLMETSHINIFNGMLEQHDHIFSTGNLHIRVNDDIDTGAHAAIDSASIVVSRSKLESSMRNMFQGKINSLTSHHEKIIMKVDVGDIFEVQITRDALINLDLQIGDQIWLGFKSSSVKIF